ncbi:MAG TPA: CsbD family protein [Chloroflexota bacterium]|nr:CsbD family protein [Chloroflexota bacterium]
MAGKKDKLTGKAMQAEGKATGDPVRQAEGKAVSMRGELKDQASKLKPEKLAKGPKNS